MNNSFSSAILSFMKIIVTHNAPDWDAISSVWLIKRYLPGWRDAIVEFVPAGTRRAKSQELGDMIDPIEIVGEDEVIHVDTGLGPLDHHQTADKTVCGATKTWDYIQMQITLAGEELKAEHVEAVSRIVAIILADDHFREVFWADPMADYHEFSLIGLLEGIKLSHPDQDNFYMDFGMQCLDGMVHTFESRIWSEKEIADKGISFRVKRGRALAFETVNDGVIKLAQKMGYILVVRKDPRKGYVRIKARPASGKDDDLDLTAAYEKLQEIDSKATWFLHVSKKMLLNGTPKNPKMVPTTLTLEQIIEVLKSIY